MSITSCPRCQADLRARRETWFTEIVFSEEGSLLSATPREDMDDVWRVYCAGGHEFVLPGMVSPSALSTPEAERRKGE